MTILSSRDLCGKQVWSQDGHEVGEIEGFEIAVDSWAILGFDIKVRREVLADLRLKKPLVGSQTVRIAPEELSGIGDAVILKSKLTEMDHTGGKPVKE